MTRSWQEVHEFEHDLANNAKRVNVVSGTINATLGSATGDPVPALGLYVAARDTATDNLVGLTVDGSGGLILAHSAPDGSALPSSGVLMMGSDGTNAQNIAVSALGVVQADVTGAFDVGQAAGSAGMPCLGFDGTDYTLLRTNPDGAPVSAAQNAVGIGITVDPIVIAGQDVGTGNATTFLTSNGMLLLEGVGENGAAVPDGVFVVGGVDGSSNARRISTTTAGIVNVVANASENVVGFTTAKKVVSSVEFTRPADTTAYASADCVSSSTSAPSQLELTNCARVSGGDGWIVGVQLWKSTLSTTAVSFRVHFFNTAKTPTNDNSALVIAYTDKEEYIGSVDLQVVGNSAFTASLGTDAAAPSKLSFKSSATSLWCVLEVRGAYTPGNAETFYIKVECLQN